MRRLILHGSIQLVFSNFYLGIALGALQYASKYTVSGTRAWPFGGDVSKYLPQRFRPFWEALTRAETLNRIRTRPRMSFTSSLHM